MRYPVRNVFITSTFVLVLGLMPFLIAHAEETPESCNALFSFLKGTIQMEEDKRYINPEVCAAYAFLISRYTPGPRSSVGLSNPKVEGIVRLNPDFAVALAKMMQAAPSMGIVSAYRTPEGQGSKNPQSNHIYGCAVDLGYAQGNCGSAHCQWVVQNAPAYGLHIRMKYSPEWNHIEPIAKDACRSDGPGVGVPVAMAPTSGLANSIRESIGLGGGGQNCTLPDGLTVPCSAIANPGGGVNTPGPTGVPTGGAIPRQTVSGSQQIFSGLPSPTSVQNIPVPPIPQTTPAATSSTGTSTLTAFERIMRFAEATRVSRPNVPSVPLVLTSSIYDIATIQPDTTSTTPIQGETAQQPIAPIVRNDTFTSSDLGGGILPAHPVVQTSSYQQTLTEIQSAALAILAYLRPFGRPVDEEYASQYSDWSE